MAGGDSNVWNVLINVICNVAPAFLLGIAVGELCQKFKWSEGKQLWFILLHIAVGISFAFLWCFFTLVNLSVWVLLRDGVWAFNWWGNYALQWQFLSGLMAYLTITSSVYVQQANEGLRIETQRNADLEMRTIRAESARQQAELNAIRSQLNPHFLFNTLHSLMALVRTDSAAAETAIEQFAQMLRYVLQSQSESNLDNSDVLFADEWEFIETYLKLEKLRLGARLKVTSNIEKAAFDCRIPAFLLQPLIENSIKWAISPRIAGGEICVNAQVEDKFLKISVNDNGAGTTPEKLVNAKGFGLRLIREMLAARYGETASLKIETALNQGFTVNLIIPIER